MKYRLMGNRNTTIHSVKNLQRKFNRQHRRMGEWARVRPEVTTVADQHIL